MVFGVNDETAEGRLACCLWVLQKSCWRVVSLKRRLMAKQSAAAAREGLTEVAAEGKATCCLQGLPWGGSVLSPEVAATGVSLCYPAGAAEDLLVRGPGSSQQRSGDPAADDGG